MTTIGRSTALLFAASLLVAAPAPVRHLPEQRAWVLESDRTSYVIALNERQELEHVYWGNRVADAAGLVRQADRVASRYCCRQPRAFTSISNEEYPGWGGYRYEEPCLKATFEDGLRDVVLKYVSHKVDGSALHLQFKDVTRDLHVTLHYQIEPRTGIITKWSEIENRTPKSIILESAQSGVWTLPRGEKYRLSYLHGAWGAEVQMAREEVQPGVRVLESRRGITSHQMNPWFAIDARGEATEESGRVWFGALGWSGNWKLAIERTEKGLVRVTGGYNTFDFNYQLTPGERLATPRFYAGYTDRGFGEASRLMHRFQLRNVLPQGARSRLRPIWFQTYIAVGGAGAGVNEANLTSLVGAAAKAGIEVFHVDDGWFGNTGGDTSRGQKLGDWFVDPGKFPKGMAALSALVKSHGMEFGLWFEPEAVGSESVLYRTHPEWLLQFRDRQQGAINGFRRNLNLARDDVKEYLIEALDKMITSANVRVLRVDMNRNLSEPGWPEVAPAMQTRLWVKYVNNVYEMMDRLQAKHPLLEFESCAGGGGRVDLGILRHTVQVHSSDETDAVERIRMAESYSFAYTPKVTLGRINGDDRVPLKFRTLVAMRGSLTVGLDPRKLSPPQLAELSQLIQYYKSIRATMQEGDLYRILSPFEGNTSAYNMVSADGKEVAVFAFLHEPGNYHGPFPPVRVRGVDGNAFYRVVRSTDEKLVEDRTQPLSGAYLMHHGLNFRLAGKYDCSSVVLERVAGALARTGGP